MHFGIEFIRSHHTGLDINAFFSLFLFLKVFFKSILGIIMNFKAE